MTRYFVIALVRPQPDADTDDDANRPLDDLRGEVERLQAAVDRALAKAAPRDPRKGRRP